MIDYQIWQFNTKTGTDCFLYSCESRYDAEAARDAMYTHGAMLSGIGYFIKEVKIEEE